jgi:6-phosphogluconolactonase
MSNPHLHRFESDDLLAASLANTIAENLREALSQKGTASLIVSGGSTPKKFFHALSQIDLDWENVKIGLCDERWVEAEHIDSNEKLVRENLMVGDASKATFIGMFIEGVEADDAQSACAKKIEESLFPFDVIVLGMGDDAHTASLFPHNPKLHEAYESHELCISIKPVTAPHIRMSLTRSAILSSRHLYLHFQGEKKGELYQQALEGNDTFEMPIRSILHQSETAIEVYTA